MSLQKDSGMSLQKKKPGRLFTRRKIGLKSIFPSHHYRRLCAPFSFPSFFRFIKRKNSEFVRVFCFLPGSRQRPHHTLARLAWPHLIIASTSPEKSSPSVAKFSHQTLLPHLRSLPPPQLNPARWPPDWTPPPPAAERPRRPPPTTARAPTSWSRRRRRPRRRRSGRAAATRSPSTACTRYRPSRARPDWICPPARPLTLARADSADLRLGRSPAPLAGASRAPGPCSGPCSGDARAPTGWRFLWPLVTSVGFDLTLLLTCGRILLDCIAPASQLAWTPPWCC